MCVDYRLEQIDHKKKVSIPIIDDLMDELNGLVIFLKIDLCSKYHQIWVRLVDTYKTTFPTHLGHYEFLVMPFGLTNALATFQAMMNQLFGPYLWKFVLVFFDDMLVYNITLDQHVE